MAPTPAATGPQRQDPRPPATRSSGPQAFKYSQGGDKSLLHTELSKARDSLRHAGRRERRRIISRTLLVKGLEYDHIIIADATNHSEVNDFYVALTRARKSIHILANGASLTLGESPRGPKARKEP
ncbi:ATP-binding domain-containing protein [Nocardioides salarius]|uniref:ATP-binding domain-containing protein n=1 Tax=Nocardioides salarius TaxID=374513 RepID=UPI00187A74A5